MVIASLFGSPAAQAGTYDVHACGTPAGKFTNHSWTVSVPGADFESASCSASDARPQMVIQSTADKQYAPGRAATMTFTAPDGATIANFWLHRQLLQFNPVDNAPAGSQKLYSLRAARPDPRWRAAGAYDSAVMTRLGSHGAWWGSGESYNPGAGVVMLGSYAENAGYPGDQKFVRFTVGCHTQPCALRTNGAGAVGAIFAAVFGATVTIERPDGAKGRAGSHPTGLAAADTSPATSR